MYRGFKLYLIVHVKKIHIIYLTEFFNERKMTTFQVFFFFFSKCDDDRLLILK